MILLKYTLGHFLHFKYHVHVVLLQFTTMY